MKKKILLTNGDGSLSCGIARVIERYYTDKSPFIYALSYQAISAINHYVDKVIRYPLACKIDGDYDVTEVVKICKKESIDLIIPLTDHECVLFSKHRNILPAVLCSNHELSNACYDKWLFIELMNNLGCPVPDTCLPSRPIKFKKDYLIKPRKGGLSRGLVYGNPDLSNFSDDHIAQEYLDGTEVTVSFYKSLGGNMIGPFVAERTLFHGITNYLKVIAPNNGVNEIIKKLAKLTDLIGPCNIQGKIKGECFTPFEINLRFSGTSSLRDSFGFKDVISGIEENLFKRPPLQCDIKKGCAVRYFADLVFYEMDEENIINKSRPSASIS